jgi:hypothetical protein
MNRTSFKKGADTRGNGAIPSKGDRSGGLAIQSVNDAEILSTSCCEMFFESVI